MRKTTTISVVVLCIFASFCISCVFVGSLNDQKRFDLKKQYDMDVLSMEEQIDNLSGRLFKFIGDENRLIGTWSRTLGNGSIFFDTIYIYSNNTAGLYYTNGGVLNATYTMDNGMLIFKSGTEGREFNYVFFNEDTLVVSNPFRTWPVDPIAVYIRL